MKRRSEDVVGVMRFVIIGLAIVGTVVVFLQLRQRGARLNASVGSAESFDSAAQKSLPSRMHNRNRIASLDEVERILLRDTAVESDGFHSVVTFLVELVRVNGFDLSVLEPHLNGIEKRVVVDLFAKLCLRLTRQERELMLNSILSRGEGELQDAMMKGFICSTSAVDPKHAYMLISTRVVRPIYHQALKEIGCQAVVRGDNELILLLFSEPEATKLHYSMGVERGIRELFALGRSVRSVHQELEAVIGSDGADRLILASLNGSAIHWDVGNVKEASEVLCEAGRVELFRLIGQQMNNDSLVGLLPRIETQIGELELEALMKSWSGSSPRFATEWAYEQQREAAMLTTFRVWLTKDSFDAAEWAGNLAPEAGRDRLVLELITFLRDRGAMTEASEWTSMIVEPATRSAVVEETTRN